MKQVLWNKDDNKELADKGYVVVDFLNPEATNQLRKFYEENPDSLEGGFHTTHFSTDTNYKKQVQNFILSVTGENIQQAFCNYNPVFANFMVKEATANSVMPLHADWTYVDENDSSSYAIWIPLVDTNITNGCIGVIPFSHYLSNSIRGPRILQWESPAGEILINKLGKLLSMKAGQALIYNHRTLHYSPPNNSKTVRAAINISLVPTGEKIIHYAIPEGENSVLKFEVTGADFFLEYDNFQMPKQGKLVERIGPGVPLINEKADAFVTKYSKQTFFSSLKNIFRGSNS